MSATPESTQGMPLLDAVMVLQGERRGEVVVTTMGASREWLKGSNDPLDFHFLPSAMGHAPALGLGLALAQPKREVWVLNGDGSMLMSLGVLATIAASGAKNLTLFVCNNGRYEVTGGQRTVGGLLGLSFAGFAHAAKFASVFRFDTLEAWRTSAAEVLRSPGPRFIEWTTLPVDDYELRPPGPMKGRVEAFRQALAS